MDLPHHLTPVFRKPSPPAASQPCYTEDRLPYASSMVIRPRIPVWLTPLHTVEFFSLIYVLHLWADAGLSRQNEPRSHWSPGLCWAMIWQTANHSLAGRSSLGTGPQRMVIPLWSFLCKPKASGQWQCFPSQRSQYAYQGHLLCNGHPQASLYKGPGCDLRSA